MDLNFDPMPIHDETPKLSGWRRWCATYNTRPKYIIRCSCVEDTSSNALFDFWSIVHVFFGMVYSIPMFYTDSILIGFVSCFTLAIAWELIENMECVRYYSHKAFDLYNGDNIWNSVADVISCLFGFVLVLIIFYFN